MGEKSRPHWPTGELQSWNGKMRAIVTAIALPDNGDQFPVDLIQAERVPAPT
jgi:hypothetical protein